MKILLVKSYPHLASLGNLAKGLKKRGHEVHIVIPRNHPDAARMRAVGIKVTIINFWKPRYLKEYRNITKSSLARKMMGFLKRNSFDVVSLNLVWARKIWGPLVYLSGKGIVVSTVRGFEVGYNLMSNYFDHATVTVCNELKDDLVARGLSASKVTTIYNGLDIAETDAIEHDPFYLQKELGLPLETKLIGMAAYFYTRHSKGHKVFIDAAKIVLRKHPDARFVLIGCDRLRKGAQQKYFENYTRRIGLKDKVFFLGERDDVFSIMSSLYICALPSMSEGCPNVLLEAMSRHVPVVASRIKSIGEIVIDGRTGILVETGNSRDLARAIKKLLDDPKTARRMGLAGRRRVEKHFNASLMAEQYEKLFAKLLRNRSR